MGGGWGRRVHMGWGERWSFCSRSKAVMFFSCRFSIMALVAAQAAFSGLTMTVSDAYSSPLWPQGDGLYTQYFTLLPP